MTVVVVPAAAKKPIDIVPGPKEVTVNLGTIITIGIVVVALIGAGVALAFAGWDPAAITGMLTTLAGFATPMIAVLDRSLTAERNQAAQGEELAQQTVQLQTITRQTNGVLTERIRDEISTAMQESLPALLAALSAPLPYPPAPPAPDDPPAP